MTERDGASTHNLTGVWDGTYSYGSGEPSVAFVATLIESGATLTGTTHEPCIMGGSPDTIMLATLLGSRQGQAIRFVKTYEGNNPYYGTVHYEGTLNADATEIEGRWMIPGHGSGTFLMIRPTGAKQTIVRKSTAKV
jgi:hypothetical protein